MTTPAGEALEDTCTAHFLTQHVQCPTRGDNTLDLVMSTFNSSVTTQIMSPIGPSDHAVILSDFTGVLLTHEPAVQRTVWRYKKADWNRLRSFSARFIGQPSLPTQKLRVSTLLPQS